MNDNDDATVIPFPQERQSKPRAPRELRSRPARPPEVTTEEVAGIFDPDKLHRARVLAGISSRRELAEILGVPPEWVGHWETGSWLPPARLIRPLGNALGYPIGYFQFRPGNTVRLDSMAIHICENKRGKS